MLTLAHQPADVNRKLDVPPHRSAAALTVVQVSFLLQENSVYIAWTSSRETHCHDASLGRSVHFYKCSAFWKCQTYQTCPALSFSDMNICCFSSSYVTEHELTSQRDVTLGVTVVFMATEIKEKKCDTPDLLLHDCPTCTVKICFRLWPDPWSTGGGGSPGGEALMCLWCDCGAN